MSDIDVKVKIENTYASGTIINEYDLKIPPAPLDDEDELDEWFNEYIYPHTGTGRSDDYAIYEVTITEADAQPALIGQTYEWGG
jgi:hypothetical protein